jgi:hypothetical protein
MQVSSDSLNQRRWIRGLLHPWAALANAPFGIGPRLTCIGCLGRHHQLLDVIGLETSGLPGVMRSVRLRERLSVSVYAVRRGVNSDHTRGVGRTSFFDCLVVLFMLSFRPWYVIVFLYHATLVHAQDKARRGKPSMVFTSKGFRSA